MKSLSKRCARLAAFISLTAVLVLAGCGDGEPADQNQVDPCPCDGEATCETVDDADVCVSPVGGDCATDGYVCDSDMVCQEGSCRGDQGFGCQEADDCSAALNCIDGSCQSPCPCDDSAECETDAMGTEICLSALHGPCDRDGYQCDDDQNLSCDGDVCLGEPGFECGTDDDCSGDLDCLDGTCEDYDGPCPCDGDAECRDEETDDETCVAPVGDDCSDDDYVCDDGLDCEDGTCVAADEWTSCDGDDDCGGDYECIGGFCTEETCEMGLQCPDDGDSNTVVQSFCNEAGDGCVECRHWADESAGYGDADCEDGQVCTSMGYCTDRTEVPRSEPFTDDSSMEAAEAVAIATAVCSIESDDEKVGGTGSANYMCSAIVSSDDADELSQSDIQSPAEDGEFDYLADEDTIDGHDAQDVADEIESVWDESLSSFDRLRWFSEGDLDTIPSGSHGEIVIWMGSTTGGAWRIGIDTLEGYFERGYVSDWDQDGQ